MLKLISFLTCVCDAKNLDWGLLLNNSFDFYQNLTVIESVGIGKIKIPAL